MTFNGKVNNTSSVFFLNFLDKIPKGSPLSEAVSFWNKSITEESLKKETDYRNIITGGKEIPWCAATVSRAYKNTVGVPFDNFEVGVLAIQNWSKNVGLYKSTNGSSDELSAGDLLIWKGKRKYTTTDGDLYTKKASHIGQVLHKEGKMVYVVEGNANILKRDEQGRVSVVKTATQGKNGNQEIGELQEKKPKDKVLVKRYFAGTIKERDEAFKDTPAKNRPVCFEEAGISGYADMYDGELENLTPKYNQALASK